MTGWLSLMGIAVILAAGLYTGLTATDAGGDGLSGVERPRAVGTPLISRPDATPTGTQQAGQEQAQPETPVPGAETRDATAADILVTNRLDCEKIRGTDYHSPEERTWFLSNCVRR